jgi:DNA-binding transcriptional regulator GbsR (MarR family)
VIKRSKPGSRTLLYESGTQSFQKHFLGFWKRSSRLVEEKVDLINNLLSKIESLSENSKEEPDVKRLKEVLRVFNARYTAYLEILNDFIEKFEEKMANFKRKIK